MENTIDNKARFFAQYWWQKVINPYSLLTFKNTGVLQTVNAIQLHVIRENDLLNLKPLSSISGEHALKLKHIFSMHGVSNINTLSTIEIINQGRKLAESYTYSGSCMAGLFNVLQGSDYLRSESYALPYLGLSVETQIEYGWVRLEGNN